MREFLGSNKVVFFSAHSDDVELGCSCLIAKMNCAERKIIVVCEEEGSWKERNFEAYSSAVQLNCLYERWEFKDKELSLSEQSLFKMIEKYLRDENPDCIFVNSPSDFHYDHVALANAVINATRRSPCSVIFYETPTTKINTGEWRPNLFVELSDSERRAKKNVLNIFQSQIGKPFMDEMFNNLSNFYYKEKFQIFKLNWREK